jgi:hypothetical protein
VIIVIEPDDGYDEVANLIADLEITNLDEKLAATWSADVDVWEKIKRLDDILKGKNGVTLIKIYRPPAEEPDWLTGKKWWFDFTEKEIRDKKLDDDDAFSRGDYQEWYFTSRLSARFSAGMPMPGSFPYEFQLIKQYKSLERHEPLSNVQDDSSKHPIDNRLEQDTEVPIPPQGKRCTSTRKKATKKGVARKSCTREKYEKKLRDCIIDYVNRSTQGETVLLKDLVKVHGLRPEVFRKKDKNDNLTKGYKLMQAAKKVVAKDRKGNKDAVQDFLIKLLEKLPK